MNSLREWEEAFEQAVDVKNLTILQKEWKNQRPIRCLDTAQPALKQSGRQENCFKRNAGNGPSECSEGQDQGGQLGLSSRSPSLP